MFKLEYSHIVKRKLKKLCDELTQKYGENNAKKIIARASCSELILLHKKRLTIGKKTCNYHPYF